MPFWRRMKRKFGIVGELIGFMATHKKWWLTPIFIVLLLMLIIILVGSSPLAPIIYPLF